MAAMPKTETSKSNGGWGAVLALTLCVEVRVCGVLLENPEKRMRVGAKLFGELIEHCHEARAESPN